MASYDRASCGSCLRAIDAARAQPTVDRGRGERMSPFALLPEIRGRAGNAVLLDRAEQELGCTPSRRPEVGVELFVTERAPRRLVSEQDRPGLVELVLAPGGCERPVGPVALQPEAFRLLRSGQPAQRAPGEVGAARGQEREHDECEVAPPDEAVATGMLEVGVELGRGDHRTGPPVAEQVEDEQRPPVERTSPSGAETGGGCRGVQPRRSRGGDGTQASP